jgi:hypothetical protein
VNATSFNGLRVCGWLAVTAAVALVARAAVYSFTPRPTPLSASLAAATGGPSLVIGLVACALAVGVSVAMIGTAAVAVAERSRLEPLATSASPGIRPLRVAHQALVLLAASSIVFALVESYVHWRAGLGWHGLRCLTGPVHRDALPFLAALWSSRRPRSPRPGMCSLGYGGRSDGSWAMCHALSLAYGSCPFHRHPLRHVRPRLLSEPVRPRAHPRSGRRPRSPAHPIEQRRCT